ncbi:MAG TPA: hypothetical protein VL359_20805, partial [bacterium]|nr:hypothetical protein [bacterium]
MNRLCPLLILLGLFLSASAPRTAGQETQSATTQRLIVLTVQDLSGPSSTHGYDQPITDAVAADFAAGGAYQIVPTAEWQAAAQAKSLQPRDMMAGSTAAAFGRATGAALVVSGAYAVVPMGSDEQIALTLQCWDAATGALRAGLQRTARFDLSFYLELQDWVAALGQSLQSGEAVPTQAQDALPPPAPSQITFLSHDEAMEVLLGGDTSAGFVANGRLVFPINGLKDGTVFSVTKRKPGYHESVQAVKAAPQVLLTPLAREHPGAVEVFLTTGQVLGLGAAVRGYGIPDWFYASLGTYAYVQTPQVAALRYVFHDDISFRMG